MSNNTVYCALADLIRALTRDHVVNTKHLLGLVYKTRFLLYLTDCHFFISSPKEKKLFVVSVASSNRTYTLNHV